MLLAAFSLGIMADSETASSETGTVKTGTTGLGTTSYTVRYVYDKALVFDNNQIKKIDDIIMDLKSQVSKKTGKNVDFYVVTYARTEYSKSYWGEDFLAETGLKSSSSMVVLILIRNQFTGSADLWNYNMYTYGDANIEINQKEVDYILDDPDVKNNLKGWDQVEGVVKFLSLSADAYKGRVGAPVGGIILVSFVIALLVAGLACLGVVLKYKMKTKQNIYPIEKYTKLKLKESNDVFRGSYVRKRIIQTSQSRSGGGRTGGGGSGFRGGR